MKAWHALVLREESRLGRSSKVIDQPQSSCWILSVLIFCKTFRACWHLLLCCSPFTQPLNVCGNDFTPVTNPITPNRRNCGTPFQSRLVLPFQQRLTQPHQRRGAISHQQLRLRAAEDRPEHHTASHISAADIKHMRCIQLIKANVPQSKLTVE